MYDLYETYVDLHIDGSDIAELRTDLELHFSFVSEYSQPIASSNENGTFSVRKFFETFIGTGYQFCLGLGDVPETFYRFYVDFDEEEIYISGTSSQQKISFANLDINTSTTRSVAERSYITEEF